MGVNVSPAVSMLALVDVTTGTPAEVTVVGTTAADEAEDCALAKPATRAKSDNDLANMMVDEAFNVSRGKVEYRGEVRGGYRD